MADFIRQMVRTLLNEAIMPTGKDLPKSAGVISVITAVVIIMHIIKIPCLFSIQGCLIALLVMCILVIIERSEYHALLKVYGDVKLRVGRLKERQQSGRSGIKDGRASVDTEVSESFDGGRSDDGLYSYGEDE